MEKMNSAHRVVVAVALAGLLSTLGACPGPKVTPKKTTPDKTVTAKKPAYLLLINTQVDQGEVFVDGERVADLTQATATPGLALAPGVHRLEVRSKGFTPFRLELKLVAGKTEELKVELQPKPKPPGGV